MRTLAGLLPVPLSGLLLVGASACSDSGVTVHNSPPTADISSHQDGDTLIEGELALFIGTAGDSESTAEELLVTWYLGSDVACPAQAPGDDGATTCEVLPEVGAQQVILVVQDPSDDSTSASVDFTVVPTGAPQVEILLPTADGVYYSDAKLTFEALISDTEDEPAQLTAAWASDLDDGFALAVTPDGNSNALGSALLAEGEHFLTLTATDTSGKTGTDSVTVTVGPPNSAPTCEVTAPPDDDAGEQGATVIFEALVADVDVPANWLAVTWSSDKDGELGESTPESGGAVAFPYDELSVDTHVVTLTVTDEVGADCSSFVVYTVGTPPAITLTSPSDGDVANEGESVSFQATVADGETSATDLALSWTSDLDGEFSTHGSDSTGAVLFTESGLSAGTHAITARVTDSEDLYAEALVGLRINALPTAPTVALTPDPATTADDLVVSITTASTDADGDPITYDYAWSLDGVPSAASTSSTLPSADTAKDQTWTVAVAASDSHGAGPAGSDSITIDNTPPVLADVTLSPDPATEDDTLTCSPGATSDADGTTGFGYSYAWQVDGTDVGETASTLDGASFDKDETVVCTVTPNDGDDDGAGVDSNSVTIGNTAPVLSGVAISPTEATNDDTLTCAATADDADGDTPSLAYSWANTTTGASLGSSATLSLSSATASSLDTLQCTATVSDGDGGSDTDTASLTLSNRDPVVALALSPSAPASTDTLTCTASTSDDDDDSVSVTWSWTVDGSEESATSSSGSSTTLAGVFGAGQVVACTATVDDGVGGSGTDTASVTIANTAPEIASVSLSPTTVYTDDTLTASVTASDADGDTLSYSYAWYVDSGLVLEGVGEQSLDGATAFDRDQTVSVQVTPSDGSDAGATVSSGDVVVSNSAPSEPVIAIAPADPHAGADDAVCVIDGEATDADGDSVSYAFAWQVDGVDYGAGGSSDTADTGAPWSGPTTTTHTDDTVPADDLLTDEEWTCAVTPSDGTDDGTVAEATATVASGCWALEFAGADAGDNVSATLVETAGVAEVTMEAWIKLSAATEYGVLFVQNESVICQYAGNTGYGSGQDHWICSVYGLSGYTHESVFSLDPAVLDTWTHVVAQFDNGVFSMYLDGVLQGSVTASHTALSSTETNGFALHVGDGFSTKYAETHDGLIASLRVSDSALYSSDFSPDPTLSASADTLLLWRLLEGSGSTATDEGSAGADGAIAGANWVADCP